MRLHHYRKKNTFVFCKWKITNFKIIRNFDLTFLSCENKLPHEAAPSVWYKVKRKNVITCGQTWTFCIKMCETASAGSTALLCFVCPSLWGSSFRLHCGLMRSFSFLQDFNIQTRQVDVRFCVFVDKLPWSISGVLAILREEDKVTKNAINAVYFVSVNLIGSIFQVTFRDSYICIERWGWRCCSC